MTDWQGEYFHRIRPVIGQEWRHKTLAVWDLSFGFLTAEALARTGLKKQLWFDTGQAKGAFCRTLGQEYLGKDRCKSLESVCRTHNELEKSWQFDHCPQDLETLKAKLKEHSVDLLMGSGGSNAKGVARAALDQGIPFIVTFMPKSSMVGSLHVVWTPESTANKTELLKLCEGLDLLEQSNVDDPSSQIDRLEAQSMGLSIGRWLLSPKNPPRPDLFEPIIQGGRAVILRGTPTWPWTVKLAKPNPQILSFASQRSRPYLPPLSLTRNETVLVVGLGTGSLFCAEAPTLMRNVFLVDCKNVTPVNPVRQTFSTRFMGQPKAPALAEILAMKNAPKGQWEKTNEAGFTVWKGAGFTFGGRQLRLTQRDPDSIEQFGKILDDLKPTLAIVSMGRSKDDNFTATYELRKRGIKHVTPTAFPGVKYFKHILTDGSVGPCYDCLQGHLAIDGGPGPTLQEHERELYYGGSQPATLAETLPSAHSLLRLSRDLALPIGARPFYLHRQLSLERNCFLGANQVEKTAGGWLYGVNKPFKMVTYGIEDLVGSRANQRCPCGRTNNRINKRINETPHND